MKPKHIGIILDGNRRFAKKLTLQPWKGHEFGAEKVRKLLNWCEEFNLKELTLYAFSMQNFNRPEKEFNYLMDLFNKEFESMISDENIKELNEKGLKIRFIGRIDLFPDEVNKKMLKLMDLTKNNTEYIVNFAMAYGAREEIVDAVKKLGRKLETGEIKTEEITEELIAKNLYMADEPDFIIRTGGDHRTSNFLAWQSTYSEWIFLEKTWPEFDKEDFVKCIENFEARERRFGK